MQKTNKSLGGDPTCLYQIISEYLISILMPCWVKNYVGVCQLLDLRVVNQKESCKKTTSIKSFQLKAFVELSTNCKVVRHSLGVHKELDLTEVPRVVAVSLSKCKLVEDVLHRWLCNCHSFTFHSIRGSQIIYYPSFCTYFIILLYIWTLGMNWDQVGQRIRVIRLFHSMV